MTRPAARLADLPPGTLLAAPVGDGTTTACLANVGGRVVAVAGRCTHADFPLAAGDLLADGSLRCAWHGARFDPATGAVLEGPAAAPLATYAVRVEEGEIFVDV